MKKDGRKMSREQQTAARQRAMKLLDTGWVQAEVAQAVGMHDVMQRVKSVSSKCRRRWPRP